MTVSDASFTTVQRVSLLPTVDGKVGECAVGSNGQEPVMLEPVIAELRSAFNLRGEQS